MLLVPPQAEERGRKERGMSRRKNRLHGARGLDRPCPASGHTAVWFVVGVVGGVCRKHNTAFLRPFTAAVVYIVA